MLRLIIYSEPSNNAKKVSKNFYFDVWNLIDRSDKPIFFMHPSSDLQAVNFGLDREFYLSLLKRISGIFWPYHQCPVDRNNDKERYEFRILEPYNLTKAGLINIWDEIKKNVPISIDFAHCISDKEMNKKAKRKLWDVIVPGMTYVTRNIAQEKMLESDLRVAPYVSSSRWLVLAPYMLANRAIPQKYSTLFYQKQSYNLYRFMISHSAVTFACGSELRYFVRKFLEIPAYRSAMIAYPSLNMLDYGFKDGVHYLNTYPEEAGEKALYLIKNKSIADKLVQNAWELVAKQHTASERVNQVLDCLLSFKQGKLNSATYIDGRFEIY